MRHPSRHLHKMRERFETRHGRPTELLKLSIFLFERDLLSANPNAIEVARFWSRHQYFNAKLVLANGTIFKISALISIAILAFPALLVRANDPSFKMIAKFSNKILDFPKFSTANAIQAPKSTVVSEFNSKLVLVNGNIFKISALTKRKLHGGLSSVFYVKLADVVQAPKSAVVSKFRAE
ncbi:Hypothetical protein CINCED_3A016004 [Cinara cedri]|uniref:Uncharacterized protein n=1 Tax=Cinara cedri TaxID=506608 RepID=A0A5E4MQF0_9HEMI|nr:Hypothetical protein CINCED_3A016004 [Cinara cedri]